ncbi:MAG TPA: hypothetical protein VFV20_05470, partial [Candidatus Limnocylindria bacterium]|nr:hypothetical protein [Candidatus Limnocylindria bacterium]
MSQGERGRSVKLDASDHEGIAQLGAALRTAGYTPDRMKVALRAEGDNLTPRSEDVAVVLRLLPERDRLADVIRLFLLGVALDETRVADALAPLTVDHGLRLGILERSGADVRAAVRILPSGDLLFACDRELESSPDLPPDHV